MRTEGSVFVVAAAAAVLAAVSVTADPLDDAATIARQTLLARHGAAEEARIARGVDQVRRRWRAEDGDAAAFRGFVEQEFVPRGKALDDTFARLEFALERIDGYFLSMGRDLRQGQDLDRGPMLPIDARLAELILDAHVRDDLFHTRIAFVVLLNFPLTTLDERLQQGPQWTRRQWAEARLTARFETRVPAEVEAARTAAYAAAEGYVNRMNIYTHHLLGPGGVRLFPAGQRLISHWNLRDEIKARYSDPQGLAAQRLMARVMDRIVTQTIPAAVVDNPLLDWDPGANTVTVSAVKDVPAPAGASATPSTAPPGDERYRRWLDVFRAERAADRFHPEMPSFVDRRFAQGREIPEKDVRALLVAVLDAPLGAEVAHLIEARLGRKLEPFDVWYAGFRPGSGHPEAELDALTRKRYPTPEAYAADIPRLLHDLGFNAETARFVADHIVVDPSRGPGHALGPLRRDDAAHLRTRVGRDGMDYKGYNIAVHEMGHNVEQVFSTIAIDHTLLAGVPNNAFTEALAFVFQHRDLQLLGLGAPDAAAEQARALEEFWGTREIAGAALVDTDAWHWLYAHPEASPAEFRAAVVQISKDVWNRWYAPLLGARDVTLLGVYSHMISYGLYLPDYALGHLIAVQVDAHFAQSPHAQGEEFERVARLGNLTPDLWMREAVGAPLSAQPLLDAARSALTALTAK